MLSDVSGVVEVIMKVAELRLRAMAKSVWASE